MLHTLIIAKSIQIGNNYLCVSVILSIVTCFYFQALEEYYTGEIELPLFNGVTDGSAFVVLMFLVMTFFGNNLWRTPIANAGTKSEIVLVDGFSYLLLFIVTQK